MTNSDEPLLGYSYEEVSKIAVSAYWNVMAAWEVDDAEQVRLIGLETDLNVEEIKKTELSFISGEMLERISLVLKIYKYLGMLFPSREQSHAWVKKENDAFDGKTALQFILEHKKEGLLAVAEYLNSQFQMPHDALDKDTQKEYILTLIFDWAGSREKALNWYENNVIPALGITPMQAVERGEYSVVLRYIEHINYGGYS